MTSGTARKQPRRLGADDFQRILAVWQAAGLSIRPQGRDTPAAFAQQLAGGTQIALGVDADGALVGVVLATHDGRKGWINRLAVHPDYQRQGIALQLVKAAEDVLYESGLHVIGALIEGDNPASYAAFEAAGYHLHADVRYLSKRDSADA